MSMKESVAKILLGAALMGKKKGDVFTFETPNGKQTYAIQKVA